MENVKKQPRALKTVLIIVLILISILLIFCQLLYCSDTFRMSIVNSGPVQNFLEQSPEYYDYVSSLITPLIGENKEITGSYDSALAVRCHNGTFVGQNKDGINSWLGIPYATQPTDENRWRPITEAPESDRVFEAYYFGHTAPQPIDAIECASLYTQGEDCLTLNVVAAPAASDSPRPVMVFIHGGGYTAGGTTDPLYKLDEMARNNPDVIFASIGYRLGILGFANFENVPGGEEYAGSDNLGLLDQIEALKWIQRNVAGFGGDPENVTIFGESAGGGSIIALMCSDLADGLFQHAISESGNASTFTRTKEDSQHFTDLFMKAAGVTDMDGLLALDSQQITAAFDKTFFTLLRYTYPVCDGVVLPEDINQALAAGAAKNVDFMTGTNKDEADAWVEEFGSINVFKKLTAFQIRKNEKRMNDAQLDTCKVLINELSETEILSGNVGLLSLLMFHTPARNEALSHEAAGGNGKTYVYYFTEESEWEGIGSCHGMELRYVFGLLDDTTYSDIPGDPDLAKVMQRAWVNFAKTGNPSIPAGELKGLGIAAGDEQYDLSWDEYGKDNRRVMHFDSVYCGMQDDPLNEIYLESKKLDDFNFIAI